MPVNNAHEGLSYQFEDMVEWQQTTRNASPLQS